MRNSGECPSSRFAFDLEEGRFNRPDRRQSKSQVPIGMALLRCVKRKTIPENHDFQPLHPFPSPETLVGTSTILPFLAFGAYILPLASSRSKARGPVKTSCFHSGQRGSIRAGICPEYVRTRLSYSHANPAGQVSRKVDIFHTGLLAGEK